MALGRSGWAVTPNSRVTQPIPAVHFVNLGHAGNTEPEKVHR